MVFPFPLFELRLKKLETAGFNNTPHEGARRGSLS
jgi:hypothetical protein